MDSVSEIPVGLGTRKAFSRSMSSAVVTKHLIRAGLGADRVPALLELMHSSETIHSRDGYGESAG